MESRIVLLKEMFGLETAISKFKIGNDNKVIMLSLLILLLELI